MELKEKILLLRKKAGLSQEDLANKMDITRQAVYKWETGVTTPDLDNVKALAKLFGVSFDYLMDDSIEEELGQKESIHKPFTPRKNVCSNRPLSVSQANIDDGYAPERKADRKFQGYSESRRKRAERDLTAIGATEIVFLQPIGASAFFYDSKKKVCGLYFAGQIQYVIPVENLVSFDFGGGEEHMQNTRTRGISIGVGSINSIGVASMPNTMVLKSRRAWGLLTYKSGSSIKEVRLDFSVLYNCLIQMAEDEEQIQLLWDTHMRILLDGLKKLQIKINALVQIGQQILMGVVEVPQLCYDVYLKKNKECAEDYVRYLEIIKNAAIRDNKKMYITKAIKWGVIAVIGLIVILAIL